MVKWKNGDSSEATAAMIDREIISGECSRVRQILQSGKDIPVQDVLLLHFSSLEGSGKKLDH